MLLFLNVEIHPQNIINVFECRHSPSIEQHSFQFISLNKK